MNTRMLVLFLLCIAAGMTQTVSAQSLANYKAPNGNLSRTTGITYNSIEYTGYAVPSWRFTGSGAEDDDRSFPVSIGFDFWYLGTRYTSFSVSTNGFIDFSTATNSGGPSTNQYGSSDNDLSQPATATTRTMPLTIAPFYYDQTTDTASGGLDALGNGIRYLTTGSVGSRVLTVEWIRCQPWFTGGGGSPSFNYQVKLYEGTGKIEFVYGYMDISSFSFAAQSINIVQGYTSGMNGTSISAAPTAAEMLVQQTANTATFSNAGVTGNPADAPHTLQTIPVSYSMISFSPPVPTAPTSMSFTSVTQTSMQVNWSDSPNEIAYVVYRSDDGGATFNYITQLSAGTLNYNQTGLLAGTTYYWRVFSVSEGGLSSALTGNTATTAAGSDTSAASGNWSAPGTWKSGIVPTSASNVVIDNGHTVTIDQNITVNSLSVGKGTSGILQIGNDATARSVTVIGNVDIRSGGTFRVNTASNSSAHSLNVTGNITNSGTFDMSSDADSRAVTNFTKSGTQSISGSGATTRFYLITMNLGGSASNFLDVFATNFSSSATNYLTLTSGIFNLATGVTTTPFTGNVTIPLIGGLRVNHSSAVLNTTGGSITVAGDFRVMNGTVNIGSAADNNLISNGGVFIISGGALNVAGRFDQANSYALTNLTVSGGTMTLNTTGSTSTTNAPFQMSVPGSIFNMSGGTIVIQNPGSVGVQNLGFVNTSYNNYSVTGGTIQIGNSSTTASSTIKVNSSIPVYNFVVNNSTVTAQLVTNNLSVLNNLSITLGTLNANALNISVAGNWSNSATFTPSTGKVTFSGTGSQSITDPSGETFNKLFITNSIGSVTMVNNVTVSDSFSLATGTFAVGSLTLTLNGHVVGGGTLSCGVSSTVNYTKGTAVQSVIAANYGNLTFSNFTKTLPSGSTVGIAGTFTPGNAAGHTITGSTISFNSSGAQNIPSFQYNNLTMNNGGTKTLQSGADSVLGTLTIGASNTLADGGVALNVFGAVANSGSHSGAGAIVFRGASSQSLTGAGTFQNVTLNNTSGVVMTGNTTINGVLTFTNGVLTTGTDTVTIGTSGSVSRTSGHVFGWLEKNVAVGSSVSRTFELGDAAAATYTPATFVFATVSSAGNLAVSSVSGEHPNVNLSFIDPTDNVNRYFQSVNSGGLAYTVASGYSLTLTFINPGDLDQTTNTASFRINVNNGIRWDSTTAGTRTATATQATGVDSLGVYVVGMQVTSGAYRTKGSGNWNDFTNVWERFNGAVWVAAVASPTNADGLITIQNGHTVTVTAAVTTDQTIVESGGTLVVNGGNLALSATSNALLVNGTFKWQANTFSGATATTFRVGAGGLYQHAITNAANTAIPTGTWSSTSTCEITGATAAASNGFRTSLGQTFGNFKWNSSSQTIASVFNGSLVSVAGDLIVTNTGTSNIVLYTTQATTTNIGGSLIVNGGRLIGKNGNTAATINVGRNDSITSGSFRLSTSTGAIYLKTTGGLYVTNDTLDISAAAVTDSITIRGDLSLTGGLVTASAGTGIIALQGTSNQIFTSGSTMGGTVNVVVFSGAIMKMGTSTLSGNSFTLSSGGTLKIGSTAGINSAGASGNIQTTTRTFSSVANYIYEGSSAQFTGTFTTTPTANTVFDLEVNNSAGVTMSTNIAVNDTLKLTSGNLAVSTLTLTINNVAMLTSGTLSSAASGTVNYNKASAGQSILAMNYGNLTLSGYNKIFPSSGTVGIAGTFTKNYATGHTITGSTVNFNGTAQSIPKFTFNNLIISASGTNTADSTITVNGNLTLSAGTLSLTTSSVLVTAKGNVVNNAATSGSGKVSLSGGASSHLVSGSGTYNNLELNDALGATSSSDITVNGTLTLTSGAFGMGSSTMIIGSAGTTVQTSGYVYGKMQKNVPVNALPQTVSFEVGDAATYAPVSLTFNAVSVAGNLTVSTTGADHPQIKYSGLNQYKDVNRYWTLTNSGVTFTTYDVTLYFVAGDLDAGANTNAFFAKRYNSTWFAATTVLRNSTWIKNLNNTGFGDFSTGEVATVLYWTKGAGTYNWGDDNNWSTNSQPTAFNDVTFDGKDTINVNVTATTNNLILQNDTLRLTILAGKTLTVSGNLTQYGGDFRTKASFPTVTGTVSLSGGTFGYDSAGGPQTVAAQTYNDLRLTGSGGETKTAASSFTTNGNLTIGAGTVFADAGTIITVKDSLVVNGAHTGAGKILLDGTVQHQLTGTGSLTNLQLNNSSNGISLDSNITINGTLTLSSGIITAANDTLYISSTGTVARTSGHINGNLRKYFAPLSDSLTFEIGNSSTYIPATVSFGTVSVGGNLTMQMFSSEHPDIVNSSVNLDSSINRYWIVRNNGIAFDTYNITFNWLAGDVDAGISDFSDMIMVKKDNGVWDEMLPGTVTSTSMRGMNGTSFSEFAVGKPSSQIFTSVITGNWSTAATWDLNKVPKRRDKVVIASPHVVSLVDTRKISRLTINSGGELADGGFVLDLYGSMIFNGRWSGSGIINWRDNVVDTLSGTAGKATGTSTLFVNGTGKLITAVNDTLYRVQIATGNTITNNGTVRMTRLIGDAAGSTWVNAANSSLNVSDSLLVVGTLTSTANNNTVIYNSTAAQTVKSGSYVNLTLSGARAATSITLPSTLSIAGTFSPSATFTSGNYVTTGNTIDYNGTGTQTIAPFDYNNVTVSGPRGSATVSLGNTDTIAIAGTLSLTATAVTYANTGSIVDFNGTGAQTIPAFNYNKLRFSGARTTNSITLASSDTIGVSDTLIVGATFTSGNYITTGSKIAYNGTGRQTVVAFNYNNLSVSGSRTTNNVHLASTGTVGVAGTFANSASFSSGTFITTGSTVDYNGTGAQTVMPLLYNNLTISGARTTNNVTLAAGTIGVASTLAVPATFTSGAYVNTGSTVNYNGTGAQTVIAFNYNDLTISGVRTTNNITLAGAGTIGIAGTLTNSATFTSGAFVNTGSTVNYNGTGAQTVAALNYNNLTISGAHTTNSITLAGSGTIGVASAFTNTATFTSGAFVNTGSTFNFNGTGAQTITAFNYNNLTISGARTTNSITLANSGTIGIAGTFSNTATFTSGAFINTGSTVDYNGTGAQPVIAFNYNNLTISGAHTTNSITLANTGTIAVAGTFTNTATFTSGAFINTGSTLNYNGTGAQTIIAFNYNNLTTSGARTTNSITLAGAGTVGVAGTWSNTATFTSGAFVTTGSTVDFNGSGAQTVNAFNYNHLTISGTRTTNSVTLVNAGTIGIAGTFSNTATFSSGTFITTANTVNYNGTGAQTVAAFNYNNLTVSGARTTNSITLASSGTIGVASTFSNTATFTSGDFIITGSTVSFNGAGAQSVPTFRYNNLQTATGGTKTATGTLRIYGTMTIGASSIFDAAATTDTVYGDWTNSGTFTPSTSTIVLAGGSASAMTGVTTFATLVANKTSQTVAVNLGSNMNAANVTMTSGTMNTSANTMTITSTRTGNGIILGTVTRTHTFSLSTPYAFEGPNSLITFTAGTTPSSVTMTVAQTAPAAPTFVSVSRAVSIAMTGGSGLTATLRLHYENVDANSLNETIMKLWQFSSTWQNRSSTAFDSVNNYIESSGLTNSIVGNWGIGSNASSKTVSDINGGIANAGDSLLYTITVTNPYNVTKGTIIVTDQLDNNLILKSGTMSNSGGIAGQSNNGNGSMVGGTITWPSFSLASGASASRTFKTNTDSMMDVLEGVANTATIDFGGGNTENVSASVTITNIANIAIDTNVVSIANPIPGDTLVYTLKYRNTGTSNATSVTTTYTIPANTTFNPNGYGALKGTEVNGVAKTNTSDGDEVTVSGSTITITFPVLSPGLYKQVKFKTIVN
ncbi:MAG: fibronectin type III domain-containing protein [Bacteroidota bacterium]